MNNPASPGASHRPPSEKRLLRLHMAGMLALLVLLTLALGGYFTLQQASSLQRDQAELEEREQQNMRITLESSLRTLRNYLLQLRQTSEQALKDEIRQQTDQAWQLASTIYQREHRRMPEAELRQLIRDTLRPLRFFDGRGYFFIDDVEGNCVLLPTAPEREGQSLLDNRDDTGHYIMRGLLHAIDNPQHRGFSYYRWYVPGSSAMADKLAYVRLFEPLGWLIGSGDYLYEADARLRQQALKQLRNTHIGRDGYISVIGMDGSILLSPGNPAAEGHRVSELTAHEREVVEHILAASRAGGGFVEYQWSKPGEQALQPKLSLVSNLDEWGMILVTGIYLHDVADATTSRQQIMHDSLRSGLLASLGILLLISSLALTLSLLYSRWLGRRFTQYRQELEASHLRLRQYAETDPLTGLPNQLLLRDRLEHAITHSQTSQQRLALLCIDLDHFKNINDSLGHAIGDGLLVQIARQLQAGVRPGDTVSRSGGDEFVILLENLESLDQVATIAQRLLHECNGLYDVEGHELATTLSIGIALYPDDGQDMQALLKNADAAMYHAKACGRNNYQFFTREMTQRVREHLQMESLLRQALPRNELYLVYQPKIDLASGRLDGCEALLRWRSERLGEVSPASFIPVAEECGLIAPLGEWVLRRACQQAAAWQQAGHPVRIAVNVSACQFSQCDLPALVAAILQETGLHAGLLELELTESVLVENHQQLRQTLARLRQMGICLTMDDFGTGFSSLSYLNHFHLDILKIDRSFICDLPDNGEHCALSNAIIAMAHALGMHCVAEGIETPEQLTWLRAHGCESGQGFLFARPLPVAEFQHLLQHESTPLVDPDAPCTPSRLIPAGNHR